METGSLFLTVVLACMTSSLIVGAAVYFFCRLHERRQTGPTEAIVAPAAPEPASPYEQKPVMTAAPVPAQTYVPPGESPQAEAAPGTPPSEPATRGKEAEEKIVKAEIKAHVEVVEPEKHEIEEAKTPEQVADEAMPDEAVPGETEEAAHLSPEPFFREYMGPGKLVPIRISERTRAENDDAFLWL